jgi:competence protein ComEA
MFFVLVYSVCFSALLLAAEMASINLNTAGAQAIADALNGVGLKKAEAIVAYREANGPFKAVEDVALVKGIGMATLNKNQGKFVVE